MCKLKSNAVFFIQRLASSLNRPNVSQSISGLTASDSWGLARPLERLPGLGVVFLDFDGVLHSGTSGTFALLPKLEDLLAIHPGIDIVISSTWRNAELEYLKRYFSVDISPRVIGVTPEFDGIAARGREIVHIVNAYRIKNWIALDDDPRLFGVDFKNIIYTERSTGITDAHLEALAKHFCSWKTT